MNKLLLTIALLISCICLSQQVPSQAEIDKMIEQAQRIANGQQPKQTTNKPAISPTKSASSILTISVKQPVQVPTKAQATDKLLWYKGKKLNDSLLVTTKGMLVLFSKKRNLVIVQPSKTNDPFQKMINNLSRSKAMTEAYINKMFAMKNSFMNYPIIQFTVDEFNYIEKWIDEALRNTIELPVWNRSNSKQKGSNEDEEPLEQMNKELQELLRNPPNLNFRDPPKKEFSLAYFCDSNAQKKYKRARQEWEEEFTAYENALMSKVFQIEHYMQLTGNISISRNEPGAPTLQENMAKAFQSALDRVDAKVKALTGQHGKNIFSQEAVLSSVIQNERKKQLMGMEDGNMQANATITELVEGEEFEKYIRKKIAELDYDVMFNAAVILGRGRQSAIMGSGDAGESLQSLFYEILALNRFALTAEVDVQVNYNDNEDKAMLKASARIMNSTPVFVSLARAGCKWTLHLSETDYENAKESQYYIPMQVKEGIKMVRKEEDKWVTYAYTGPRDMLMHFPSFRINFGDLVHQDTAFVQQLRYDPTVQLSSYANNLAYSYTIDLLGYLQHVFISATKSETNQNELVALASNFAGKFSSFGPGGSSKLEQLRSKYQQMMQKLQMEQAINNMAAAGNTRIFFDAFNRSPILIDQKTNTTRKEKEVDIIKGIIHFKVVHSPKSSQ